MSSAKIRQRFIRSRKYILTSQKGITERQFGSQNYLPHVNLVIKYSYQTRIWPSDILTGHDFLLPIFLGLWPDNYFLSEILNIFKTNVCPCPWPDYKVPASASNMSRLCWQERRETHHVLTLHLWFMV